SPAERVAEIRELNAGAQLPQAIEVAPALVLQRARVQPVDTDVRKRVATDLMVPIEEGADLMVVDHAPMRVLMTAGAAGDVESTAHAAIIEDRRAVRVCRVGDVIEGKAYDRSAVAHDQRLRAMMPGRFPQHAGQEGLKRRSTR